MMNYTGRNSTSINIQQCLSEVYSTISNKVQISIYNSWLVYENSV